MDDIYFITDTKGITTHISQFWVLVLALAQISKHLSRQFMKLDMSLSPSALHYGEASSPHSNHNIYTSALPRSDKSGWDIEDVWRWVSMQWMLS